MPDGNVKKPPGETEWGERNEEAVIGREEHEGRATDGREATPAQWRYLRRLLGRYVRRIGGPDAAGGEAFSRPLEAVCYALARHVLSDRERLPQKKREAHDWIGVLEQPEDAEQGSLRILDLARRRGESYSAWRVAALSPLADLYSYPDPGWLDRLNAAIGERYGAVEDERERQSLLLQASAFRSKVVDPCFRAGDAEDGSGGDDGGPASEGDTP